MAISKQIQPARFKAGGMPNIQSMAYKTGEAIIKGSLVTVDSDGLLNLLTSDTNNPADNSIKGVALEPAGSKPGYSVGHADLLGTTQYTGRVQEVSIGLADAMTEWLAQGSSDASTVATPAVTNIGEQYRIAKASNGLWYIDLSDTSPANCTIVDVDITRLLFIFKFTEVAIQAN